MIARLGCVLFCASALLLPAAEVEVSETAMLLENHSLGWVRANAGVKGQGGGDLILDEARWGRPAPGQIVERHWDWQLSDEQWREAVAQKGEGKREEVKFDLWLPDGVGEVRGLVVISGHGSGEGLYRRADLRALARELHLGLLKFIGNPMQRGFWPRRMLYEKITAMGAKAGHAELSVAPLFLYGHSNGTGFSAIFPATEGARVWGWVSMRPGTVYQVYQPGAAQVPGLIIFGEDDPFFARPSKEENMAIVTAMRQKHGALWSMAVEPKTGHGPGEKTWPLVLSFLRHSFAARVSPDYGPVELLKPAPGSGWLGQNWDSAAGGYQNLPVASAAAFAGEKAAASWLVNEAFARNWQAFQRDGQVPAKP